MHACAPPQGDISRALQGFSTRPLSSADVAAVRSQAPATETLGIYRGARQVAVVTAFPVALGADADFLAGVRSGATKQDGRSAIGRVGGVDTVRVDLPAQTFYTVRRGCRILLVGAAAAADARGFAAMLTR